jgi:hypothetical protein
MLSVYLQSENIKKIVSGYRRREYYVFPGSNYRVEELSDDPGRIYAGIWWFGHVVVLMYSSLDIKALKTMYSATRVKIRSVKIDTVTHKTGEPGVYCRALIHYALDMPPDTELWKYDLPMEDSWSAELPVNLDVTGYDELIYGFLITLSAFGSIAECYLKAEITFEVETPYRLFNVTVSVRCREPISLKDVSVYVDALQSSSTDEYGYAFFKLKEGRYRFTASKIVEGKKWSGETDAYIRGDSIVEVWIGPPEEVYVKAMYWSMAILGVAAGAVAISAVLKAFRRSY